MAFARQATIAQLGDKITPATSWTTSGKASANASVGDLIIVAAAFDNPGTTDGDHSDVSSVTDSAGNTYTKLREYTNGNGSVSTGAVVWLGYCILTNAIVSGTTTWTVNFANQPQTGANALTAERYTIGAGSTISNAGGTD